MQLDQSRIAICERSWADNLDLALHVLRTYGGQIALYALATIVPLAALNHLLLSWALRDAQSDEMAVFVFQWLVYLVMIETPLATAPVTLYLGQALFVEKPQARVVVREFIATLPQMLLLQVLLRAILVVPVVTWFIPYGLWPYLNEVILLERNPLVSGRGRISTLKRNSQLHRGNVGDNLVRAILSAMLAILLAMAIYMTADMLARNLVGVDLGDTAWLVQMQAAFWLVAVYFTVSRFLSYLDVRIRNEGWEVELLLRAERARLTRQVA